MAILSQIGAKILLFALVSKFSAVNVPLLA